MNIKLDLSDELVAAIEFARRQEDHIPSRVEMIRRLIEIGAVENLKRKAEAPAADKIAAAKQRTAESRERTAALRAKK